MHRRLLAIGIVGGCLCVFFIPAATAEDPLQLASEQFFALPLDGTLTIENSDGAIHVYGWYEPRVRIAAVRKAYSAPRLHQIEIVAKEEPGSLAARTVIPPVLGWFADRSGTVEYTVTAPETARLNLRLANGEITLSGLRGGKASVELRNGRLRTSNCFARVAARGVHGVMEVFYDWWENLPANFVYDLQNGRIAARLPATAHFRVAARTADGHIQNGFGLGPAQDSNPGQSLEGATAPDAPVSLGLRATRGNITLDAIR